MQLWADAVPTIDRLGLQQGLNQCRYFLHGDCMEVAADTDDRSKTQRCQRRCHYCNDHQCTSSSHMCFLRRLLTLRKVRLLMGSRSRGRRCCFHNCSLRRQQCSRLKSSSLKATLHIQLPVPAQFFLRVCRPMEAVRRLPAHTRSLHLVKKQRWMIHTSRRNSPLATFSSRDPMVPAGTAVQVVARRPNASKVSMMKNFSSRSRESRRQPVAAWKSDRHPSTFCSYEAYLVDRLLEGITFLRRERGHSTWRTEGLANNAALAVSPLACLCNEIWTLLHDG
jgi:hypothetical protein